jgi:hypothetical protein
MEHCCLECCKANTNCINTSINTSHRLTSTHGKTHAGTDAPLLTSTAAAAAGWHCQKLTRFAALRMLRSTHQMARAAQNVEPNLSLPAKPAG